METYVVKFCTQHGIRLHKKVADNYRIIPFPVYHKFLQLGQCQKGITDGVIAYVYSEVERKVYEVQWNNCICAQTKQNAQFKTGKSLQHVKQKKPKKEKPLTEKQQRKKMLEDLFDELTKPSK